MITQNEHEKQRSKKEWQMQNPSMMQLKVEVTGKCPNISYRKSKHIWSEIGQPILKKIENFQRKFFVSIVAILGKSLIKRIQSKVSQSASNEIRSSLQSATKLSVDDWLLWKLKHIIPNSIRIHHSNRTTEKQRGKNAMCSNAPSSSSGTQHDSIIL